MILISHRGNTNGIIISMENTINYILKAFEKGFDVEVDVWYNKRLDHLALGHDAPKEIIKKDFLEDERLWCHAKNVEALQLFIDMGTVKNYFWHQRDAYTLTSSGYIWSFPGEDFSKDTIVVLKNDTMIVNYPSSFAGICSNYIERFK